LLNLTDKELRSLLDWAYASIKRHFQDNIPVEYDFYWRAGDAVDYFCVSAPPTLGDDVGSLRDELDLLRKSVLNNQEDIPEIVLERIAFLMLAISASMSKRDQ
jgi:hypothetical protein